MITLNYLRINWLKGSDILKAIKRELTDLTSLQINNKSGKSNLGGGDGITLNHYSQLVNEVAELSFMNHENMLFFRGQSKDYKKLNSNNTTLYPSIYRGRVDAKNDSLSLKVRLLNRASELLVDEIKKRDIIGKEEIIKKRYVQWSILQHYEVCDTPLLDLTHSLRVACSFALNNNVNEYGYIYVLALPYVTHRISTNSEQETIIVRLLSICPPQALRPYYQDGYLVGTEFVIDDISDKSELDFERRLVGKYRIKNSSDFWDQSTKEIPDQNLYPNENDNFIQIIDEVKRRLNDIDDYDDNLAEEYGRFMLKWNYIERIAHPFQVKKSFLNYLNNRIISKDDFITLSKLNEFRNTLVHKPNLISIDDIQSYNALIDNFISEMKSIL